VDLDGQLSSPFQASLCSTLGELFWYALMASAAWLFFYVAFRTAFRHRRISKNEPTARQVCREVATADAAPCQQYGLARRPVIAAGPALAA